MIHISRIAWFALFSIIVTSCGNSNNNNNSQPEQQTPQAKQEAALPAGSSVSDGVFRGTGEIVVFFEPSNERMRDLRKDKDFMNNYGRFADFRTAAMAFAQKSGRTASMSNQDDVKITVTDSEKYVIYAPGIPEGFGVILAKKGAEPKILRGITDMIRFERELTEYYN